MEILLQGSFTNMDWISNYINNKGGGGGGGGC